MKKSLLFLFILTCIFSGLTSSCAHYGDRVGTPNPDANESSLQFVSPKAGKTVIGLPKTGQTATYHTGDDGDLKKGEAWPDSRFTVNGDCITDNLTGLMWSKDANLLDGTKTWQEALDYASNLTLCGHNDWRLPNRRELRSLTDHSKYAPALPAGHPFINVQPGAFWSSTTYANNTAAAWFVDMRNGYLHNSPKTDSHFVWPVHAVKPVQLARTGQTDCYNISGAEINCSGTGQDGDVRAGVTWPPQRFTTDGNCVTDNLTRLMWAKKANLPNGAKTWHQALDYIASINSGAGLCGYHDWRLPNVNELESPVNAGAANSAPWLNGQGFSNAQSSYYWSSTTGAHHTGYAWCVHMQHGGVTYGHKSSNGFVWPVRSGQ